MLKIRIVPSQPALMLEGKNRSIIITDLHIGFETSLFGNNIFVGKNTTIQETINGIEEILEKTKADSLILLGDVKSSIKSISKNEWSEVPLFFKKMSEKVDTILVPGNHDANIQKLVPDEVTLASSTD